MTDDLTTLLRDAGRGPTVDLDVDRVHTRGRRRAVGRRVAVGAGALALLGVVAVGATNLLDTPDTPVIEQPDAVPAEAGQLRTDLQPVWSVAAEAGHDVALHRYDEDQQLWVVERIAADRSGGSSGVSLPAVLGTPVVGGDGSLWSLDADGVLRRDETSLLVQPILPTDVGALPVGTDAAGTVVVGTVAVGPEVADVALSVDRIDAAGRRSPTDVLGAGLPADGALFAYHELDGDAVLLGVTEGDGADVPYVALVRGGRAPVDLLAVDAIAGALAGRTVLDVALVGDEVWLSVALDQEAGPDPDPAVLRVATSLDGPVTTLPWPQDLDRSVVTTIEPDSFGDVVLLGRDGGALPPLVVRVGMVDATADGAITQLDQPGIPTFLPPTAEPVADVGAVEASCGDDLDAVNAPPAPGQVAIYRWCTDDAAAQVTSRTPLVAVDSGIAVDDPPTATQLAELVRATSSPVTDDEDDAGLVPVWEARPATNAELTVQVERGGLVVVDWTAAYADEQLPLSTPFPAGLLEAAIAGAVLQFDAFDEVEFRVDGSCGAYGARGEAGTEECIVVDRGDVLWAGHGGEAEAQAGPEELVTDGRQLVLLSTVEPELGSLTVDPVVWLTGDDADQAYAAESGDTSGAPNDHWIVNDDPRPTGTVASPEDVTVRLVFAGGGCCELQDSSWAELVAYVDDRAPEPILAWLELESGTVVSIEEQYVP